MPRSAVVAFQSFVHSAGSWTASNGRLQHHNDCGSEMHRQLHVDFANMFMQDLYQVHSDDGWLEAMDKERALVGDCMM